MRQKGLTLIDDWIARLITEGYDRDAFFNNICLAAQEITSSQQAAFPALNNDGKTYRFLSSSGSHSYYYDDSCNNFDDNSVYSWTMQNDTNLLINDVSSDPRAFDHLPQAHNIKSALLTPVTLNDEPYGAIAVFREHGEFDSIDEQLMTQFGQSVQMAIINMQLVIMLLYG